MPAFEIAPGYHYNYGQTCPKYMVWGQPAYKRIGMIRRQLFVERRPQGDYKVRRPNSERVISVFRTQGEAIDRAGQLSPDAEILVESVRYTSRGTGFRGTPLSHSRKVISSRPTRPLPSRKGSSLPRLTSRRGVWDFYEFSRFHIVDVAVYRNVIGNKRVVSDAHDILDDALRIVREC